MQVDATAIIGWCLSGGGGAALTKGLEVWGRRGRNQSYTMGAVDHAVQTAMTLVTVRLERVEGQHEECERNLAEVRDDLAGAKAEIARLLSAGQTASYETLGRPLTGERLAEIKGESQ